jgi:fatty-acyl-CoA synthase
MDTAALVRRASRNLIGDALGRAADHYRDRLALRFGDRRWSFRELDAISTRIAAGMVLRVAIAWSRLAETPTTTCCAGWRAARPA